MQEITISTCLQHIAISCCCSASFIPIMQSVHIRAKIMMVFPFKEKNNGPYISSAKMGPCSRDDAPICSPPSGTLRSAEQQAPLMHARACAWCRWSKGRKRRGNKQHSPQRFSFTKSSRLLFFFSKERRKYFITLPLISAFFLCYIFYTLRNI